MTYAAISGFGENSDQFAQTPPLLLTSIEHLLLKGRKFDFDPCPVNPQFNGLTVPWKQTNFANPPYNDLESWLRKGRAEVSEGNSTCFLIPFRPTTRYFAELLTQWTEVAVLYLIRDRVKFLNYTVAAPFLSCLVWLTPGTHPPCPSRYSLFRAPRPLPPAGVAKQLEMAEVHTYSSELTVAYGRELARHTFLPNSRTFVTLTNGDIGGVARHASKANVHALLPLRPTSRDFVPLYLDKTEFSPKNVAFCIPHLIMKQRRSPFPSMLCTWGDSTQTSLGLEPFRCRTELIFLHEFNGVYD